MVTDSKDSQRQNALSPILVTESGMVTDCKDLQTLNAKSPMLVTESGMVTDCKDLQPRYLLLVDYQYYTL